MVEFWCSSIDEGGGYDPFSCWLQSGGQHTRQLRISPATTQTLASAWLTSGCLLQGWVDWILSHGLFLFTWDENIVSWNSHGADERADAVFQAYTRLCSSFHLFWLLFRSGSNPCTVLLNVKTIFKHYRHFFCTCSPVPSNGGQNKILVNVSWCHIYAVYFRFVSVQCFACVV